jgi:hypothetical protein
MYGVVYPELVKGQDGEDMPFNPEAVGDPNLPDLSSLDWKTNWCQCGHLTVDHHTDASFSATNPLLPCWAAGCDCKLALG